MKALESPLVSTTVGGVAFLVTWLVTVQSAAPSIRPPATPAAANHASAETHEPEHAQPMAPLEPVESWVYFNPEVDQLIKELKAEKEALAAREQDLNQLSTRLKTERKEIDLVAQTVTQTQAEIDKRISDIKAAVEKQYKDLKAEFEKRHIEVKAEELPNLKRLAKTYGSMTPGGAAGILREMDDVTVVKVLSQMKESETGLILEALSKQGAPEAQRVAELTEKLRLAKSPQPSPKP